MIELIGLILPPIIDLFNRKIENADIRFLFSFGFCAVIGLALNYFGNGNHFTDGNGVIQAILAVFGSSQVTFNGGWDKSDTRTAMYK